MTDPRRHNVFLDELRSLIFQELTARSWRDLNGLMDRIGISWPDPEGLGKEKYVNRELNSALPGQLEQVARWFVAHQVECQRPSDFEDAVSWIEAAGQKSITDITRQRLLSELEGTDLVGQLSVDEFIRLVGRDPDDRNTKYVKGPQGLHAHSLFEALVHEQLFTGQQPDSSLVTNREFLTSWGLLRWPDKRVISFLDALVSPTVRTAEAQLQWVESLSAVIQPDGYFFDCTEYISGRPVYRFINTSSRVGTKPKNIIFASDGPKPELGLSDAIHNDIIIFEHADSCLIYDEPIGDDGVLWIDLVSWWMKRRNLSDREHAGKDLGSRLLQSLQSEPEKTVFGTYFRETKPLMGDRLPALFPQVYLHYDPKTLAQLRNNKRLSRQQMDFLLLLPHRSRIVLEVDGKQHYCDHDGVGDPARYAETVREDRSLRLAGYEVYRFGGNEFRGPERGRAAIGSFFRKLLARHGLLKEESS